MRLLAPLAATAIALAAFVPSSGQAALITMTATLTGAQEVPGPGDPDGFGTALLTIDDEALTVDWDFDVTGVDFPLTGAHIHTGPAGVAGPIIVDFMEMLSGSGLSDPDLADVLANPPGHYVNLHNADFPAGAIRGQLATVPTAVAEPGTLALLAAGLLAGIRLRRRRSV